MQLKNLLIVCFLFAYALLTQLVAQGEASIISDSNQVETGNPLVLHFKVPVLSRPDTLNFSAWAEYISPKNLLSKTDWTRDQNSFVCDVSLIFFDADTFSLPPLVITHSGSDTFLTNTLEINVYPTPASEDLNDMAPIKDIIVEPTLWSDYLPLAAMILGALLVLYLLYRWMNQSKKVKIRNRELEQPAHILALKKLHALQQQGLWEKGAIKEYCASLTFIIREYLEKRYKVLALESSSTELLAQLKSSVEFPDELRNTLRDVLTEADLAKFAKAIPADTFYEQSMNFAQELVRRSIPKEEPTNPSLSA
jgi:hypothetical protein